METREISQLINCLTDNEDHRQELWVHYLSGGSSDSFSSHLDDVSSDILDSSRFKNTLWDAFKNPPSDRFYQLLDSFSSFEQSIMCLLMLGLSIKEIGGYKGISEIRIYQAISSIKNSRCWGRLYGIKEETDGGGEVRS